MADVTANIGKGRVVELYNRVENNDPANSAFIIIPISRGTVTDAQLRDADTITAVLALGGGITERTTNGWNRKTITDADLAALPAPDDANDRYDVDMPDLTWTTVALAGGVSTDLLLGYDSDTTGGTDANIVFLGSYDFAITPDGSDVVAVVNAAGFYRSA
jgi:hypothetical protein